MFELHGQQKRQTLHLYRLMKADPDKSKSGKVRGEMVRYLGSAQSAVYQQMKQAIARRNCLQGMKRQLKRLEVAQGVSGGSVSESQPPLTSAVQKLQQQVLLLLDQFEEMTKELEILRHRFHSGRSSSTASY